MPLKKILFLLSGLFSSVTAVVMGAAFFVLDSWEGPRWMIVVVTIITAGIMAALAFGSAQVISKKYAAQMRQLKRAMKEAADGNLEVQCQIHADNEIGDLAKNFNKMVLILKSSQDDLNFIREMLEENEEAMRSSYNHIEYLAYHDTLTELPNKLAFYERVEGVLQASAGKKVQHGLLFIDLDNFKQINDTYGHEYGDCVLQQAAERLLCIVNKEKDSIARIGGDEFLIFAYDIGSEEKLEAWKTKIKEVFESPFLLQDEEFWVTMSVGCAVFPEHGTTHRSLVRNADIAMYRAKQAGKNQFCIFDKTMEPSEE